MRITHVVENLNRGGLERAVIDLAVAQRASGDHVQVVCLFERGALAGEPEAAGVPVLACGKQGGLDVAAVARMRRHLRGQPVEVLHTHNATAHYHAVAAALGLGVRRVVNTRHGMGALDAGSRRERLYRMSMAGTDIVATVCAAARDEIVRGGTLPAGKLVAVPNGIRVERFQAGDAGARARLRDELGVPASARVVGTVGRLNWAKDHATLVRAFATLSAQHDDAVLVIVGDGSLRGELASLVEALGMPGRVFLLGDRGDVSTLLAGFDVFALSSLTEGYSIALLEACAAGLPIVATDVGGNAEIVRDGDNGLVVPAQDAVALARSIATLLAAPDHAARMGAAGRRHVLEHGSVQAMAGRYRALYLGHADA